MTTVTDRNEAKRDERGEPEPPVTVPDAEPTEEIGGPVEVDLGTPAEGTAEIASGTGQDAAAAAEREKKNRVPRDQRIGQLTKRAGEAERAVLAERTEKAAIQQQLAQERQQRQHAIYIANEHLGQRLQVEIDRAKAVLEAATAGGEGKGVADATGRLTEAQAKLQQVEAWKAANRPPRVERRPETQQPERRPETAPAAPAAPAPAPELSQRALQWVETNPYFDRNHPGFNAEMAQEAARVANIIEARYHAKGLGDQIDTDPYYAAIDRHMQKAFPQYFSDDDGVEVETQPATVSPFQRRAPGMTTGVTRATTSQAQSGQATASRVTLDAEEARYAESMGMKHPDGRAFTPQEHHKAYAEAKVQQERERAARQRQRG